MQPASDDQTALALKQQQGVVDRPHAVEQIARERFNAEPQVAPDATTGIAEVVVQRELAPRRREEMAWATSPASVA